MGSFYNFFQSDLDFRYWSMTPVRNFFVSAHDFFIPSARNEHRPHVLSRKMMALAAAFLLCVKILSIGLIISVPTGQVYSSDITIANVISLVNISRGQNNLGQLTENSLLNKAAQAKADDMMARQYFSHDTPDGNQPWSFIKATGYSYLTAGENLAIDFRDAETMQTAWMNSPGHRANILNKNFEEVGVGVARGMFDGHQSTIVVQMFGTPIAQEVAMNQAPSNAVAGDSSLSSSRSEDGKVGIIKAEYSLQGSNLNVMVETGSDTVKVLADYGDRGVMLDPAADNVWQGNVPLSSLGTDNQISLISYDIKGNVDREQLVQVTPVLSQDSISNRGEAQGESVTFLGKVFNPKLFEQNIFWGVLSLLLIFLLIAIVVKRRVQHVGLVADASFVAMLAAVLTMT